MVKSAMRTWKSVCVTTQVIFLTVWGLHLTEAGKSCTDNPYYFEIHENSELSCNDIVASEQLRWRCVVIGLRGQPCCRSCHDNYVRRPLPSKVAVTTLCSEEETFTMTYNHEELNCHAIGHSYPYNYFCYDVSHTCCRSCNSADLTCYDIPWTIEIPGHESNFSCTKIADHFPNLCQNQFYARECCHSCKGADVHACRDNPFQLWKAYNGSVVNCDEYIVEDSRRCQDPAIIKDCCWTCDKVTGCVNHMGGTVTLPTGDNITTCHELSTSHSFYCKSMFYGGPHNLCCSSCAQVDTQCMDGPLLDFLAPDGTVVTSCGQLARDYPIFCTQLEFNDTDTGTCCASCSLVDTTCLDDPFVLWVNRNGTRFGCEEYVKRNLGACDVHPTITTKCCASCQKYENCTDAPSVEVEMTQMGQTVYRPMSCFDIVQNHKHFCIEAGRASDIPRKCCRSCLEQRSEESRCTDMVVTGNDSILLTTGEKVSSCEELVSKFPQHCHTGGGFSGLNAKCCVSCTLSGFPSENTLNSSTGNGGSTATHNTRPHECNDTSEIAWEEGKDVLNCEKHVKLHPSDCSSSNIAALCCQSCRSLEQCQDDREVLVFLPEAAIDESMSCDGLVANFSGLCLDKRFGSFPHGKCCRSCLTVVDDSCVDQPTFMLKVTEENVTLVCRDIHSYPDICNRNIERASFMCCRTCAQISNITAVSDYNGATPVLFSFWIFIFIRCCLYICLQQGTD